MGYKLVALMQVLGVLTSSMLSLIACSKNNIVFTMNGNSMFPFIKHSQSVEVEAISEKEELQRWSIIVFLTPDEESLSAKRVIGLPNEVVTILNNEIIVNGAELRSSSGLLLNWTNLLFPPHYFQSSIRADFFLNTNEYFVIGDNATESYDSRHHGPVKRDSIIGRRKEARKQENKGQ